MVIQTGEFDLFLRFLVGSQFHHLSNVDRAWLSRLISARSAFNTLSDICLNFCCLERVADIFLFAVMAEAASRMANPMATVLRMATRMALMAVVEGMEEEVHTVAVVTKCRILVQA